MDAAQQSTTRGLVLIVSSAQRRWALPAEHVVETLRPLPITKLPSGPPFVLGVSLIRGRATPVVGLCELFGHPSPPECRRFVTLRPESTRRVAVLVEQVHGLLRLDQLQCQSLPPLLQEAQGEAALALGRLDGHLLTLLEASRVLPRELVSEGELAHALEGGPA